MISRTKAIFLIVITAVCFSLFLFKLPNERTKTFASISFGSRATIVRKNFTCDTWKQLAYLDLAKYEQCLRWRPDNSFWSVQRMRHTAHHNSLNSSSLVLDVGGNIGIDITQFAKLYNPHIISFEPLVSMAKALIEKFQANPKIEIRPYGLANRARRVSVEPFDDQNAGTSIFRKPSKKNSTSVEIQLLDVVDVIEEIRRTKTREGMIDMLSINCEGCEFEILPALILNNMVQYIRIIQFGSHTTLLPRSACIYCQVEQALERTHQSKYHYTMLWEGWVLKPS